jgi:hypothetical protein
MLDERASPLLALSDACHHPSPPRKVAKSGKRVEAELGRFERDSFRESRDVTLFPFFPLIRERVGWSAVISGLESSCIY